MYVVVLEPDTGRGATDDDDNGPAGAVGMLLAIDRTAASDS